MNDQSLTQEAGTERIRYWVNLFTADTWAISQRDPDTAAWFADRNRKLTRELRAGHLIICFVARIGFVAVLRATDRPTRVDDGPFGDTFPVKVPAEPVVQLTLEEAMPPDRLRDSLNLDRTPSWLIQGSGREWRSNFGDTLVEQLHRWAASPERRELTPVQLNYRPQTGLASSLGEVTIPDDVQDSVEDDTPELPRTSHAVSDTIRIQASLLRIGSVLGLTPWVTTDDQSRMDEGGTRLSDLPGVTTNLPPQFDEATNETIRHIDVMWLHRNRVEAAFEVEKTTSIYSGLLRMADLLALQPNINIPLFVVAPDDRLDQALRELDRPVFRAMVHPLHQSCRVMTFSQVADLVALVEAAGGHLTTGVLRRFSYGVAEPED